MEQTKLKRFKRITTKTIIAISVAVLLLIGIGSYQSCNATTTPAPSAPIHQIENVYSVDSQHLAVDTIRTYEHVKDELISEVNKYIQTRTNKAHKFMPKYIVHAGLTHDIDICFMMAQTQIETCYGTMGAGRETSRRSLFGVALQRYNNYEDAIDAYCRLLHKSYIGRGKNEQHLMTKYVTFRGARYAANPRYENELRVAYNHIKKNTHIYNLQQEYKNMSKS